MSILNDNGIDMLQKSGWLYLINTTIDLKDKIKKEKLKKEKDCNNEIKIGITAQDNPKKRTDGYKGKIILSYCYVGEKLTEHESNLKKLFNEKYKSNRASTNSKKSRQGEYFNISKDEDAIIIFKNYINEKKEIIEIPKEKYDNCEDFIKSLNPSQISSNYKKSEDIGEEKGIQESVQTLGMIAVLTGEGIGGLITNHPIIVSLVIAISAITAICVINKK
jgi:hypothetical protein